MFETTPYLSNHLLFRPDICILGHRTTCKPVSCFLNEPLNVNENSSDCLRVTVYLYIIIIPVHDLVHSGLQDWKQIAVSKAVLLASGSEVNTLIERKVSVKSHFPFSGPESFDRPETHGRIGRQLILP